MTPIYSDSPPAFSGGTTYGNGYRGGFAPAMALNACGDGALIVGISDSSNADTHDGLFTSTTSAGGCPAGGGGGGGGGDGGGGGGGGGGPHPGPPPSPGGPSAAKLKAALLKALPPAGKLAKLGTLLKHGGFAFTFTPLTTGRVAIAWYSVPRGAHVAKHGKAKPKAVLVASGAARFTTTRAGRLTIKLTSTGKRLLKHAKRSKLTAKGTFTPTGDHAVVAVTTFTLKR